MIRNTKKPPLFETLDSNNDDGIAPLTPGHLLIGRPLEALPHQVSTTPIPVLKRWRMCQALTQHFCKRWSTEYLNSLQRFSKWRLPRKNLVVGDIVLIKDNRTPPPASGHFVASQEHVLDQINLFESSPWKPRPELSSGQLLNYVYFSKLRTRSNGTMNS